MLRVLDLFSGIGGFALGLERAGQFKTVAFCEVDAYCNKVLKQWWPDVPNFDCGIVGLNALLKKARTSSRRASPARTYRLLVSAPDLPESVRDSSGRYYEPFAWFDQKSRCWRTWQRCLLEGWEVFSGTWPRSGMTRSGIAFRRAPLVPLTAGTGSGLLLPTPRAEGHDAMGADASKSLLVAQRAWLPTPRPCSGLRSSGANRTELLRAVAMWPTPTTSRGGSNNNSAAVRERGHGINLVGAVRLWPTESARDWKGAPASAATLPENSRPLNEMVRMYPTPMARDAHNRSGQATRYLNEGRVNLQDRNAADGIHGSLNPTWVEWLMGFPLGWTDLGPSATPSSRKSRRSSAARSSRARGEAA
jgi:hypothetical protein